MSGRYGPHGATSRFGPTMRFNAVEPAAGFGSLLRQLRDERGWSQNKLADEMNIHRNQVSDYERHRRRPGHGVIMAMDRLLNADGALISASSLECRLFVAEREIERLTRELSAERIAA